MWIVPKQLHTLASVRATEALISDCEELYRMCEQSLLARSKPSRWQTWRQRWRRDCWMQHLSGRILKPSHSQSFVTEWTSSLAVIPASLSAQPESDSAKTTRDTSGRGSQMELTLCDQDGASLKTSKDTSAKDSEMSCPIWKAEVTRRRGAYSARLKWAHHTSASGSLSWPTASSRDHKGGYTGGRIRNGKVSMDTLDVAVQAHADGGLMSGPPAPANPSTGGSRPEWLTPRAGNQSSTQCRGDRKGANGENIPSDLYSQVPLVESRRESWATPRSGKTTDENPETWQKRKDAGNVATMPLTAQVKANWPTIASSGVTGGPTGLAGGSGNRLKLAKMLPEAEAKAMGCGKLNPRWVETLMGLPMGWTCPSCPASVILNWPKFVTGWNAVTIAPTSCGCSETESCQQQPNEPSESCMKNWPTARTSDAEGGRIMTQETDEGFRSKRHSSDQWFGAKLRDAVETHEENNND